MTLLLKRYSRSGYAPPWFYVLICIGFAAVAVWSATQTDWLVAAIASAMIPATIAGSRLMRRLSGAASASRQILLDAEHARKADPDA